MQLDKSRLKEIKSVSYQDAEHISDKDINKLVDSFNKGNVMEPANTLANWLAKKMYGKDVRQSLAFWTIMTATFADLMQTDEAQFKQRLGDRQDQVEERQSSVERDFKAVQQGATDDTEVKTARNSNSYGEFPVLDDRLENIEQILAQKLPGGYSVTIQHNLGRNPVVKAQYYEYAIGTETNGFGTGPEKSFGGTGYKDIPVETQYADSNTVIVNMPQDYHMDNPPEKKPDGNWYIIQDQKTIQIKLS